MQNSVISTRMTSLYGFQPSSVVFECTTARFEPELQVSMGPRSHLSFGACKTAWYSIRITRFYGSQPSSVVFGCKTESFGPKLQVSMGPRPLLSFCAFKTAWLPPELLVCMGSRPHLWLLHAKQRLLDQNCKSLWIPDLTCRFVYAKQRD